MSKFQILIVTAFLLSASAFKIQPRIANGLTSKRGQFPYYVYLQIDSNELEYHCGGTLIGDRWVVTAGHCLAHVAEGVVVHFGLHETRNNLEHGRAKLPLHPEDFMIHPQYSEGEMKNDIGLIKLSKPVEFNHLIQPAKFASNCMIEEDEDVMAVGVGYQKNRGQLADYLQYAQLKTISSDQCTQAHPYLGYRKTVFCAKSEDRTTSVCYGDSGGPLVREIDNAFVGVASFIDFDYGCESGQPQGFTNVFMYQDWIAQVTGLDIPKCSNLVEDNWEYEIIDSS